MNNNIILYCRSGFEKECAAEITDKATQIGVYGYARVKDNSGYVLFECYQPTDTDRLAKDIPLGTLVNHTSVVANKQYNAV